MSSPYFASGATLYGGTIAASINALVPNNNCVLAGTLNGAGTIAPYSLTIGTGLIVTGGSLEVSGGTGTVTQVATTGAGISGGPITVSGTLSVEWNGGTVTAIGNGITINAGSLSIEAGAGLSFSTGSLVAAWQTTAVTGLGSGLTNVGGVLTPSWNGGSVSALGGALNINSGTISDQKQGTITLSGTTTGTINPANIDSALVNIGTAAGTIAISPGFVGQRLRVEIKQPATPQTATFTNTVVYGTTITSYTATNTANARDAIQMICFDGTHWGVAGLAQGFSV